MRYTPDFSQGAVEWVPQGNQLAEVVASAVLPALEVVHDPVVVTAEASLSELRVAHDAAVLAAPSVSLPELQVVHNAVSQGTTVPAPTFIASREAPLNGFLASKDSWVDTVAGCVANDNHNATDLELAAATKDIYFAFDLSGFPAASTVTAATLRWNVKQIATTAATVSLFKITDANEGWSESTIRCDNRPPADGAAVQTWAVGMNNLGERSLALNAGWLTRLDDRMGTSSCTFLIQAGAQVGTAIIESKDEGTANDSGPRLTLTFTSP